MRSLQLRKTDLLTRGSSIIWTPGLDAVLNMWSDVWFKDEIVIYLKDCLIVARL